MHACVGRMPAFLIYKTVIKCYKQELNTLLFTQWFRCDSLPLPVASQTAEASKVMKLNFFLKKCDDHDDDDGDVRRGGGGRHEHFPCNLLGRYLTFVLMGLLMAMHSHKHNDRGGDTQKKRKNVTFYRHCVATVDGDFYKIGEEEKMREKWLNGIIINLLMRAYLNHQW